jgi:hypothetical protein
MIILGQGMVSTVLTEISELGLDVVNHATLIKYKFKQRIESLQTCYF